MINAQETVRSEEIRSLFGQSGPILWANVGVGAIVVGTLWHQGSRLQLLLWLAALLVLTAARRSFQLRYARAQPAVGDLEPWGRGFVLGSTLSGMLWGAAGVMFFASGSVLSQGLLSFAIGGMTAAAAGTLACHLPAFWGYFAFALGPLTLRAFAEGDRMHFGMGAMLLVYAFGMQRVARNNHASFARAFQLGIKNAELLAERGKLAGGLAHDFNSLLTVVLNNAVLLKDNRALDEQAKLAAQEMLEAARRGAALIRQLLAFGGPRHAQPRVLRFDEVLQEWAEDLRRVLGESVLVEVELSAGAARVRVDPGHLEQLLVNLVAHARSAMPNGGRLLLATRALSAPVDPRLPAGPYVELHVSGSGQGALGNGSRAFPPYFLGDGDGDARDASAGLGRVQAIADAWQGQVVVDARAAPSTSVRVYIPMRVASETTLPAPRAASVGTASGATVLVVDDEPTLRSVIRRNLQREGFSVLMAEDGERALQLAKSHASPIDLLITDVVMPGVSGPELARRLRLERPQLGVLLISGYTFEEAMPEAEDSQATAYLTKPFDTKALSDNVRALLAQCPR